MGARTALAAWSFVLLLPISVAGVLATPATASISPTASDSPAIASATPFVPQYLKVDGENGSTPVTYTNFTSGEDCYHEYSHNPTTPLTSKPTWWFSQPQCKVDLYWNTLKMNQKTVVLVHGGGWFAYYDANGYGRRREGEVAREADALASHGYLVAVIDYRQGFYDFLYSHPAWQGDFQTLSRLGALLHCTQRFEDPAAAKNLWPQPATLTGTTSNPLPPECAIAQPDYADLTAVGDAPRLDAMADIQSAVAWLRTDASGVLATNGGSAGKIFLVGESAGGMGVIDANYAPTSTGSKAIDGAVSLGVGAIGDNAPITASRSLLSAAAAAPLQVQDFDYDGSYALGQSGPNLDRVTAGMWDFGRQTAVYLRDLGYKVDFRSRCGQGHVPLTSSQQQFNPGIGETVAFLNGLETGTPPTTGLWFGAQATWGGMVFQKRVPQDMVEDQPAAYRTRVADFNADGFSDILWWSPREPDGTGGYKGPGCSEIWYAQGDGSFARSDLSFPVPGDDQQARGGGAMNLTNSLLSNYDEQKQGDQVVTGDFNGDGTADIFWYGQDSGDTSSVWYGVRDTYAKDAANNGVFTRSTVTPPQNFKTVAAGDLDGDGNKDLYFYNESGNDLIWYGTSTAGSFTAATITGSPDGPRNVVVGNFDGDLSTGRPIDDILFAPATGTATILSGSTTKGTLSPSTTATLPTYTKVVAGAFNGTAEGRTDLFWYNAASTTGAAWYGTSTKGTFTQYATSNGPIGNFDLSVGDFDGDGFSDIYYRAVLSGWEWYARGKSGTTGFNYVAQFEQVAGDRSAVVGQFGNLSNDTPVRDDILWHFTGKRDLVGPEAGGIWGWSQT